ncbi:hypothetical protein H6G97_20950 [Nostoc flagelliforme FACHB-838]|uniref:RuBisCO chaperone RbcX n=1 Tax=Nostoc flagelliforme FACHB-838 TaxID=2692904 RepID=A0ABR8DRU1_9NOSO|nr:hypothetical protein [Nostoc flagelliforme]MBD2531919.1 hypothetical protein [Nostoc flagelliforme FACHB-838]
MAKKTLRQLATQYAVELKQLIDFLGAKNGNELLEESDPKLQQFFQRNHNPEAEKIVGNLYTEVGGEYRQQLTKIAVNMRVKGGRFLREELMRLTAMPTAMVLAEQEIKDTEKFETGLDSMWDFNAPFEELSGYVLPQQRTTMLLTANSSARQEETTIKQSTSPPEIPLSNFLQNETQQ